MRTQSGSGFIRGVGAGFTIGAALLGLLTEGCSRRGTQSVAPVPAPVAPSIVAPSSVALSPPAQALRAQQLMDEVAVRYKGVKSYSEATEYTLPGGQTATSTVVWSTPNRLRASGAADSGSTTAVCDGKMLYAANEDNKSKYLKVSAPPDLGAIKDKLARKGVPVILMPAALLTGEYPWHAVRPFIKKLALAAPSVQNGVPMDHVVVECQRDNFKWTTTYSVGDTDHLLYGESTSYTIHGTKQALVVSRREIKLNPVVDEAVFRFTPPPGASAASTLVPTNADPRLVEGAKPFPFVTTALDGRVLALEQYKGKVILLDFWATWCGPCVGSLPELEGIYRKHSRNDFEIVGISLDDNRVQLLRFLKERKLPWRQIFDGGGWTSAVPRRYGVHAIPFTLLIGRDGHIIGMNLLGPDLEDAIHAAAGRARP